MRVYTCKGNMPGCFKEIKDKTIDLAVSVSEVCTVVWVIINYEYVFCQDVIKRIVSQWLILRLLYIA